MDKDFREFLPGYFVTSYGSQGKTVDYVFFSDSTVKPLLFIRVAFHIRRVTSRATAELGEPMIGEDQSTNTLWYTWTAPQDGTVTISLSTQSYVRAAVYLGDSLTNLVEIVDNDYGNDSQFSCIAGTTYQIVVGGFDLDTNYGGGLFSMSLQITGPLLPPPNNSIYTPNPNLPSNGGSVAGYNTGGTVWFYWMPPSPFEGSARISITGSGFDEAYGDFNNDLQVVIYPYSPGFSDNPTYAGGDYIGGPSLTFYAFFYQAYVIGVTGGKGSFVLTLSYPQYSSLPQATNDNFTNRTMLGGDSAQIFGSNVGATKEPGEPAYAAAGQTPLHDSVWYSWTAPYSGGAVVQVADAEYLNLAIYDDYFFITPIVAVYIGDSLSSLVQLGNDSSSFSLARFAFTATSNVTYQIEVDGFGADLGTGYSTSYGEGYFQLSLNLTPPPTNDLFANATVMTGNYYTNAGSFIGASREPGEPDHGEADFLQTLWWTWTAPTNNGVSSSLVTLMADAVSFPPAMGVYTGLSVSNLTPVALTESTNGMSSMATFSAQAGQTYWIALAGQEQYPPGNIISPRWGDFRFRFNNRALAVTVADVATSYDPDPDIDFDFTANIGIDNFSPYGSNPLRLHVSALSGVSVLGIDRGASGNAPIFIGDWYPDSGVLPPGGNTIVPIAGSLPAPVGDSQAALGIGYGAYVELQEQRVGSNWFTIDQALVLFGDWPALDQNPGPGGGVIRLDPNYLGLAAFDPLTNVVISGPTGLLAGQSASYIGSAFYADGTMDKFTNTAWAATSFSITNGVFAAGSVTSNTPVTLSAPYTYAGLQYTAAFNVIVSNAPPPELSVSSLPSNGILTLRLSGLPMRRYALETTTNLSAAANWTQIFTNTSDLNGALAYSNIVNADISRLFYRAALLP